MPDPQALIRQAEKLVSKRSGVWGLFGDSGREKFEEAVQLFKDAARAYQLQGQNIEAGETYERAGKIRTENLKEYEAAAESYVSASDAYRFHDTDKAIECREEALKLIERSNSDFKESKSSRINEALGKIYEFDKEDDIESDKRVTSIKNSDLKNREEMCNAIRNTIRKENLDNARNFYNIASGEIRVGKLPKSADKLLTQYADISALIGEYGDAIDAYDTIIKNVRHDDSMSWRRSTYCFKKCICYLTVGDIVDTRLQLVNCQAIDNSISSQFKYKFLADLCDAVERVDENMFTDMCHQFERTGIWDQWMNKMFHKIKEEQITKKIEAVKKREELEKKIKNQAIEKQSKNQVKSQDENQVESEDHPFA